MINKLVFDIETKNSFADVGGQEHLKKLEVSVVGAYSYPEDKYYCFNEYELTKFGELAQKADLIIGFYSKKFDIPVLEKYYPFNIAAIAHYDILEEIEKVMGRRVGLGVLAEANLGIGKTAHGLEAIDFYRNGEIEKLKEYCLQDVKITKEIFDLISKQGYLWIPERGIPQMKKLDLAYIEKEPAHAKLF